MSYFASSSSYSNTFLVSALTISQKSTRFMQSISINEDSSTQRICRLKVLSEVSFLRSTAGQLVHFIMNLDISESLFTIIAS